MLLLYSWPARLWMFDDREGSGMYLLSLAAAAISRDVDVSELYTEVSA
jgi:hypothetical protein